MDSSIWGEPFTNKHTRLRMDRKVYERLIHAGQAALPDEYTALLAGTGAHVTASLSPARLAKERAAFRWDAASLFSSLHEIRESKLQWLGVVHTHPSSAALPSFTDHAGWHYPALSYWILSLAGPEPELRAYQMEAGIFHPRVYELLE